MKHKLSYNRTKTQKCNKTWHTPHPPQIKFFILFFPTSSVDMHLKLIQTHFVLILFVVHAHLLLTNSFFLFKPLNRNTVNQERDQVTTKQKGKKNANLLKPNSLSVHNSSLFFFWLYSINSAAESTKFTEPKTLATWTKSNYQ